MIYLIIAFGFLIRLISINQSLWLDEATSALVAKMSLQDIFTKFLPHDFHPPLYYLILKYWTTVFGYSEMSLRFPSIIFGIGTICFTYLIARWFFDKKTALISGFLLATSGLSIYYSQEARMYSLASFLVSVAVYFFLTGKWRQFSIVLPLIAMADYVSLLVLPVFWLFAYRNKKFWLANILLIVIFAIWLPVFANQITMGLAIKSSSPNWWVVLGTPSFKNMALIPIKFMIGRIGLINKVTYSLIIVPLLLLYFFIIQKARKVGTFLWFWLTFPIFMGFALSFEIPALSYFRFLFCLPAFYILLARGANKSKILMSVLVITNLVTTGIYLFNPTFWRENWRDLVKYVEAKKTKNSVTIFVSNANTEAYRYYAPDAKIAGPDGVRTGYDQVWLITYLKDIFDSDGKTDQKVTSLGYHRTAQYDFNGVVVSQYENRN